MKILYGVAILATLISCNQTETKSTKNVDSAEVDSTSIKNDVIIADVKKTAALKQYINLKNALVSSNAVEAKKFANELKVSLANIEGCELTSEVANKIANGENIAIQRKNFTVLSADLIALFKNVKLDAGILYVQHCPMANKGDGGDWLSTEKEIRNPYYGDEMLACGRIEEEIKAK